MKYSTIFFLFLTVQSNLIAQTDSIIAENIFNFEIRNGRATRNRIITTQNTFDLNNRLLRRLHYDTVANIKSSTLFFYEGERVISEETYGEDFGIDSVRRMQYNSNGQRVREDLYSISDGTIQKLSSIKYTYSNNDLTGKTVFAGKKWTSKISYNRESDTLIMATVFKKNANPSHIKEETVRATYNDDKPVYSKTITKYSDKTIQVKQTHYEYDTISGQLMGVRVLNEKDSLLKEVLYRYYPEGYLRSKSTRLNSGDYIEHLIYERRKHSIVIGKPEMYAIPEDDQ